MKPHVPAVILLSVATVTLGRARSQTPTPSDETVAFFKTNCTTCHTIGGGPLAGPDLKGVLERRDRPQLIKFILDPKGQIDSGDPYLQKLWRNARNVYMQPIPGVDAKLAGKLLDLIGFESVAAKPRFAGNANDDRPLTPADAALGRSIFLGHTALENGGPACISCHTVREVAGFGGGRLGPDLTNAFARLEGRRALAAWLRSPPSNTMRPVYSRHALSDDERLGLVAFLAKTAQEGDTARSRTLEFVLASLGLAALILVLFDFLWRHRHGTAGRPLLALRRNRSAR